MQRRNDGWSVVENTLGSLSNLDLDRTITIRGEAMSAREASLRSVTHTAYHVGQILYLARLLVPDANGSRFPQVKASRRRSRTSSAPRRSTRTGHETP